MYSIIMMSCDKYKSLTPAFEACLNKYYPNHPVVYHIYGNECWTKRLREALTNITDDYILFMLDDMLVRKPVQEYLIQDALEILKNNNKIAVINFEKNYRDADDYSQNWLKQKQNQFYLHSCQPSLWKRTALIDNLSKDEDAWSWEVTRVNNNWIYLINKDAEIINVGTANNFNWGIVRGAITEEFKDFLIKEKLYTREIQEAFSND